MPVIRNMNQATATDALASKQFNVIPRLGAVITVYASCVTSGDVIGLQVGEKTVIPADYQPNIESSADVIDVNRDRVLTERVPAGQMYLSVTATTAVNVQINITYLTAG